PDLWATGASTFQNRVARFFRNFGDQYDADTRVVLVFASAAMLRFAEPMYRGAELASNRSSFLAHGYTQAKDLALMTFEIDIMDHWTRTPVGTNYNPLQKINETDGSMDPSSVGDAANVMDYAISKFGHRCVLQNNEINGVDIGASHTGDI